LNNELKDIQQVGFYWEVPDKGFIWDEEAKPIEVSMYRYPDSQGNLEAPRLPASMIRGLYATFTDALALPNRDEEIIAATSSENREEAVKAILALKETDQEKAVRNVFQVVHSYKVFAVPQVDGPFLIEAPGATHLVPLNRLLQSKTLMFQKFAETVPNEKAILDFANKYGRLTRGETEVTTPKFPSGSKPVRGCQNLQELIIGAAQGVPTLPAESLAFWKNEILEMWRIFKVWDWLRHKNYASLRKVITWNDDASAVWYELPVWNYAPSSMSKGVVATSSNPKIFKRFKRTDSCLPAQFLVQKLVNNKLKQLEEKGLGSIQPRLLMNIKDKTEPYLVPTNLLAALWLQFYQAVCGERPYKRCEVCGAWEDVLELREAGHLQRPTRWKGHPDCLNAKYQRDYRERQAKLREKARTKQGVRNR
jgi:hypothetical protein